jgi:hypothetical protein
MEEENEKKENEINVNGNFQLDRPKKRHGMQGISDILKRFDTQAQHTPKGVPKREKPDGIVKRDYLADEIAKTLGDEKSLGAFRKIAELIPERIIREHLAVIKETWQEGKIKKSRGALFISMIIDYSNTHHIELGFHQAETADKPIQATLTNYRKERYKTHGIAQSSILPNTYDTLT